MTNMTNTELLAVIEVLSAEVSKIEADLNAKRHELHEAREEMMVRLGVRPKKNGGDRRGKRDGTRGKIVSILASGPKNFTDIVNMLGKRRNAVAMALYPLVSDGRIIRLERGVYALPNARAAE